MAKATGVASITHDPDKHKIYVSTIPLYSVSKEGMPFDDQVAMRVPIKGLDGRLNRWQNPITNQWEIDESFLNEIISLCVEWFGQAGVKSNTNPNTPPAVVTSTETPIDVIISLFKMAGPDKADSVYRSLSRVFHPDLGGSNTLMTTLNNARDKYLGKIK